MVSKELLETKTSFIELEFSCCEENVSSDNIYSIHGAMMTIFSNSLSFPFFQSLAGTSRHKD